MSRWCSRCSPTCSGGRVSCRPCSRCAQSLWVSPLLQFASRRAAGHAAHFPHRAARVHRCGGVASCRGRARPGRHVDLRGAARGDHGRLCAGGFEFQRHGDGAGGIGRRMGASLQGFISTGGAALVAALIGRSYHGSIVPIPRGALFGGLIALACVLVAERGRLFRPPSCRAVGSRVRALSGVEQGIQALSGSGARQGLEAAVTRRSPRRRA